MKQMTEYNRVSGYLNKLFDKLNVIHWGGALPRPIITIQNTPHAYGHISVMKTWKSGDDFRYELNIGAGTLMRPIENTCATLLHEMSHLYNIENGIEDCSRGGMYHNRKFKEEAEKHWLSISKHEVYGWTITAPTDELLEWCLTEELDEIRIQYDPKGLFLPPPTPTKGTDNGRPTATPTKGKTSSTRKLVCPCCNASVRATRKIKVICGECFEKYGEIEYMTEN